MHDIEELKQAIESSLLRFLPQCEKPGTRQLDDAVRYAVFPGGKRLRPLLTMLGARIVNPEASRALPAACAVEFIHTSSLIFDDLPCMDNAELRRGGLVVPGRSLLEDTRPGHIDRDSLEVRAAESGDSVREI